MMILKEIDMIDFDTFKIVINSAPLVSIDFIIKNNNGKILLGQRINKPANGYLFTIGGRIYKNERLEDAKSRILLDEIGLNLRELKPRFLGVFEHFYTDSFVSDNISTHYINLAYEIIIKNIENLPKKQHSDYVWLSIDELMNSSIVHKYVKNYFNICKEN